jgi:3-dehydroquinate dehydratase-2
LRYLIINGPNLNLLGKREPEIYGKLSFEEYFARIKEQFKTSHNADLEYFQSNIEGELIDAIQKAGWDPTIMGIVLNAGGYSHTSVALADAVKAIPKNVVLVHISNIHAREEERKTDLLAAYAQGQITGLGLHGYDLALEYLISWQEVVKN